MSFIRNCYILMKQSLDQILVANLCGTSYNRAPVMMTSSNGNIFRVTDLAVTGEFPAQRPVTRSFDVSLYPHLNKTVEETIVRLVIWNAIASIMTSL